jgi:hypothetical protein
LEVLRQIDRPGLLPRLQVDEQRREVVAAIAAVWIPVCHPNPDRIRLQIPGARQTKYLGEVKGAVDTPAKLGGLPGW